MQTHAKRTIQTTMALLAVLSVPSWAAADATSSALSHAASDHGMAPNTAADAMADATPAQPPVPRGAIADIHPVPPSDALRDALSVTEAIDALYGGGLWNERSLPLGPGGVITEIIDGTGDGAGNGLNGSTYIAVDRAGNVYVTGQVSDNAFKITPGGVITEIIDSTGDGAGNTLDQPIGIAVDNAGNVFVAGANSDNAFKITPGGVITEIIDANGDGAGNTLNRAIGIVVDSADNVYVTGLDSDNAFKITPGGVITEIIDSTGDGAGNGLSDPFVVAVDAADNVYVTGRDSDNAFKITPGGVITEIIDSTGDGAGNALDGAFGLAIDAEGNAYVSGQSSDNAFKVASGGVISEIIDSTGDGAGNALDGPVRMALDNAGNLYIAGFASDNAFQITPDGVIAEIVDSTGDGAGNGLDRAAGIAVDAACNVYVTGSTSDNVFRVPVDCAPCDQSADNCQDFVTADAYQSNSTAYTSADDFTPVFSGSATDLCWWGTATPFGTPALLDDFTVTYYADAGGLPGAVIGGPFSQSGGTLSVLGAIDTGQIVAGLSPIYEYSATHAPVALTADTTVWVEIKNDPSTGETWFWSWSLGGDLRCVTDFGPDGYDAGDVATTFDFAFCVNVGVAGPVACSQSADDCQDFSTNDANQSNSTAYTQADDFMPAITGDATDLCWWGTASPFGTPAQQDDFTITYYADAAGLPGAVIGGPFIQSGGTLSLSGPIDTGQLISGFAPIYEYSATHAPVALSAGETVWVEIKNDPPTGETWYWEQSFDGNLLSLEDGFGPNGYDAGDVVNGIDRAFCVNVGVDGPAPCGDFDNDGDVDLGDFSQFSLCFAGANVPPAGSCPPGVDADCDGDGDVDLGDFSILSLNFTGPL